MSSYQFKSTQYIPVDMETAWNFFSSPKNLAKITPPELQLTLLSELNDDPIYDGMKIDYTVKPLFQIPLHWQTVIDCVVPFKVFMDTQLKGPYKKWEHIHTFEEVKGGIIIGDHVEYELPFGKVGDFVHRHIVRQKIERIFSYRKTVLTRIFQ